MCDRQQNKKHARKQLSAFCRGAERSAPAPRAAPSRRVRHFLRPTDGRTSPFSPTVGGRGGQERACERAESFFSALSGAATGSSVHHVDSSDIQWISLAFVKVNDKT